MNPIVSFLASLFPVPGRYIGEQEAFSVGDVQATVYWIPDNVLHVPGRATVLNNIWLNERARDDLSPELLEYLFLHEHGHAQRSLWGLLKLYTLALLFGLGTVGLALLTIAVGVAALWNPVFSLTDGAGALFVCLVLTLLVGGPIDISYVTKSSEPSCTWCRNSVLRSIVDAINSSKTTESAVFERNSDGDCCIQALKWSSAGTNNSEFSYSGVIQCAPSVAPKPVHGGTTLQAALPSGLDDYTLHGRFLRIVRSL